MKFVFIFIAALLVPAAGWLLWPHPPVQAIALLDIEKVIAESTPGKAGRAHLDKVDLHFRQGLQQLQRDYRQAPATEQQRIMANAEQLLSQQFSLQEQMVSEDLKKIILEEAERWRSGHNVRMVIPAQLALASAEESDCTDAVLKAVNQREIRLAPLPALNLPPPQSGLQDNTITPRAAPQVPDALRQPRPSHTLR